MPNDAGKTENLAVVQRNAGEGAGRKGFYSSLVGAA
jgi:hypothetical protein